MKHAAVYTYTHTHARARTYCAKLQWVEIRHEDLWVHIF